MSVYTELNKGNIDDFLSSFSVGQLVHFQGVPEGIENTNYKIKTKLDKHDPHQTEFGYFLTLVEYGPTHPLIDFIELCSHLANRGCPVPAPVANSQGNTLSELKGKPALLVPLVEGRHLSREELNKSHLTALGEAMAKLHIAAMDFKPTITNSKGFDWWQAMATKHIHQLNKSEADMLTDEINYQHQKLTDYETLPKAVIHGDLFMDNVLFKEDKLTGVIDFYNASEGCFIFDLAVAANDWCIKDDLTISTEKVSWLLEGYQQVRTLTAGELSAWPSMLRSAALRFWISRIDTEAFQNSTEGEYITKDPKQMAKMLMLRREAH